VGGFAQRYLRGTQPANFEGGYYIGMVWGPPALCIFNQFLAIQLYVPILLNPQQDGFLTFFPNGLMI